MVYFCGWYCVYYGEWLVGIVDYFFDCGYWIVGGEVLFQVGVDQQVVFFDVGGVGDVV